MQSGHFVVCSINFVFFCSIHMSKYMFEEYIYIIWYLIQNIVNSCYFKQHSDLPGSKCLLTEVFFTLHLTASYPLLFFVYTSNDVNSRNIFFIWCLKITGQFAISDKFVTSPCNSMLNWPEDPNFFRPFCQKIQKNLLLAYGLEGSRNQEQWYSSTCLKLFYSCYSVLILYTVVFCHVIFKVKFQSLRWLKIQFLLALVIY